MESSINPEPQEQDLLRWASQGDARNLEEVLTRYRGRLKRMVKLRLDPRVRGRIDPSDVVQEAYLEVSRKLADYLRDPKLPFFLWLRLLTAQKLALVHRQHLRVQARDAITTPSQAAVKAELKLRIQKALNRMHELDREVLALRHVEQLSNAETALVLGIKETAAANRYVRALERLRSILADMPGGLGGL